MLLRHCRVWLLSTAILIAIAAPAHAAEAVHPLNWMDLVWRIITIALVIGVIWRFIGKKALVFFSGRRTGIEQELHDLEARKEEARANLQVVEQRIAGLESERLAILADYTARGEALHAEIIAKAHISAQAIAQQARQAARNDIDQALAAMRSELAESIAEATRAALAEKLTPQEHEKLLDSFLTKVVLQ